MSAAHTEGLLAYEYAGRHVAAGGVRFCNIIRNPGTGLLSIATYVLQPDARRLVACWNAFDGCTTEVIEATAKNGSLDTFIKVSSRAASVETKLAAATSLLQDFLSANNFHARILLDLRIREFLGNDVT